MNSPRRTSRSLIWRTSVFLLLGAILNIVAAWACAMLPPFTMARTKPTPDDYQWLTRTGFEQHAFIGWRSMMRNSSSDPIARGWRDWWSGDVVVFQRPGASWRIPPDGDGYPRGTGLADAVQVRSGWPCPSLAGGAVTWTSEDWSMGERTRTEFHAFANALLVEANQPDYVRMPNINRPIPLRPIWPGFAVNTIFYAAICWLPFAALSAIRRHRRMQRGLCPTCVYPIGSSPVCTECGTPVAPHGRTGESQGSKEPPC